MKIFRKIAIIAFIFFIPTVSQAADDAQAFRVLILGTRHFADVELITKNIRTMKPVQKFLPVVANQKHLEFEGAFVGDENTLSEDIRALTADRFELKTKNSGNRGLVITLRKI